MIMSILFWYFVALVLFIDTYLMRRQLNDCPSVRDLVELNGIYD